MFTEESRYFIQLEADPFTEYDLFQCGRKFGQIAKISNRPTQLQCLQVLARPKAGDSSCLFIQPVQNHVA